MKVIVTGTSGTVAPVLVQALISAGHTIIAWDRSVVPIDYRIAVIEFIHREQPDWFFHIATGSPAWAELVAHTCAELGIKFLYTSSVSVFSAAQCGPFTVDILPQPDDEYGRYKLECEQRVLRKCPEALVVRLGWQVGTTPGGNHIVDYLDRTFKAQSKIEASIHWYQACSFLVDTAQCISHMMQTLPAGLYHLDGNPGLNFYEIATSLKRLHGEPWIVNPCETPVQNNRLIDDRVRVRQITEHF